MQKHIFINDRIYRVATFSAATIIIIAGMMWQSRLLPLCSSLFL